MIFDPYLNWFVVNKNFDFLIQKSCSVKILFLKVMIKMVNYHYLMFQLIN